MLKALFFTVVAVTLALTMSYADQPKGKLIIPVQKTDPTKGKAMYTSYCAPCHGVDGRGNGPAAAALKTPPTDLTRLAISHHGKYPETHIVAVLRFGVDVPAHGQTEMPVWEKIFGRMSSLNSNEKDLRTANLTRYLESLQSK